MAKLHPLLQPYVPSTADPFDRLKAAHLLNRAGFGGTPQEIERALELGPEGAVDWLMDFPDAPMEEITQSDLPNLSSIDGYPKNFREVRAQYANKTREERQAIQQMLMQANREAVRETMAWWLKRMAYGPTPLQEKLTLFWHGHFTTSARDERSALLMWNQNETWRKFAAGNFRQFVKAVSRDPAMLDYLNNTQNHKNKPNENYARELMELFTLGIGNYTEQDIRESARAFSGWTHDGEEYTFRAFDHDTGEKNFFGRRGNFNGDDIIELILAERACANYIGSRLMRYFGYEELEEGIPDSLGNVLREAKYELRPLVRTILTSRAFYQPRAIGSQIKSPVQLMVGTVRLLQLPMPDTRRLAGAMEQMGQVPLMPPNVKGWPGGRLWINTSTLFVRYNTCVFLAGGSMPNSIMSPGYKAKIRGMPGEQQGNFTPTADGSPREIVEQWTDRLIQRPVSDDKKAILLDALGDPPREENVRRMIQLIVSMPEYQLC